MDEDRLSELEAQVLAEFDGAADAPASPGVPDYRSLTPQGETGIESSAGDAAPDDPHPSGDEGGDPTTPSPSSPPSGVSSEDGDVTPDPAAESEVEEGDGEDDSDDGDDGGDGDESFTGYEIGDQIYSEEEITSALKVSEWASSLDENGVQMVDAALSGNYALIPIEDLPAIQRFYEATAPGATPTPPSSPTTQPGSPPSLSPAAAVDPWDEEDPDVARLAAENAALRIEQQRTADALRYQQTVDGITRGEADFLAQHPDLSDEDRARLTQAIVDNGSFQVLSTQHDPYRATQLAYQQALAADAALLQRRIDAEVAQRVEAERAQLAAQQRANAGSSALAGSSGHIARPAAVNPDDAMVAMIRESLQQ